MACPPPILESLSKTLSVDKNKLTVKLNIGTKSRKGPRIVITDLEMLDWLSWKGYNIESVLKSGRADNLLVEGNDSVWQFSISEPPAPARRATPRRSAARNQKGKGTKK
jgi:hypothetical protein